MNNMKIVLSILLILFMSTSCQESGGDKGFSGLEDSVDSIGDTDTPTEIAVDILSTSPSVDPVFLVANNTQTFAVQVNSGAGDVTYTFKLDGSLLQNSNSPFYNLAAGGLTAGTHSLEVTATNSVSEDSHTFNLRKNTAPVVALDSNTSQTISCTSDSFQLDITASDIDGDSLSFDFYLNGTSGSSFLATSSGIGSATVVFTPNCSLSGTNNVTVRATDSHGEFDEYTMAVTVSNPNIATVDSYSPSADPVKMLSSASQTFSISASGKAPLAYEWKLDGVTIGTALGAIHTVSSGDITAGPHTLVVTVSDSDSTDSHTFNIVKNVAPVLAAESPAQTNIKQNYEIIKTFSVEGSDANSDALTFTWTLNGSASTTIATSRSGNTASAIFTPIELLIGSHTIAVTVSDGLETDTHSWTVAVNRFSTACNALSSGEVCTVVGPIGFNSGGSTQASKKVRGVPYYMAKDSFDNMYVSDTVNDVIWYYNFSIVDRTVHGIDVPAYSAKIILGNGIAGITIDGKKNSEFKLNSPRDLVFDSVTETLFIADYLNNRVVQLLTDGTARRALCYGGTGNNTSYNELGPALTRGCYAPVGLALNEVTRKLYVSIYGHHNIKEFDISNADYTNWTGEVLVGRRNASNGSIVSGYDDAGVAFGYTTGGARTTNPWDLDLNADGSLLFFTEYNGDRVKVANLSGSSRTLLNGAITVNAGHTIKVIGNGGGVTEGLYSSAKIDQPTGIALYEDAGVLKGIFVVSYNRHVVNFINNTASTITIGDKDVEAQTLRWVFGDRGAYYNGDNNPGRLTSIWSPRALEVIGDTLFVSTLSTGMIRSLDINVADGNVGTKVHSEFINDFLSSQNPNDARLMTPIHLAFNSTDKEMFWGEDGSGKVRKFSTDTGTVTEVLGFGRSHQDQDMQTPTDIYNYGVRGLSFYNNQLIYIDRYNSWTTNRGCRVRAYNNSGSTSTFFGTTISDGLIGNIAGNFAKGCNDWEDLVGEQATNVRLRGPESAISDGTDLYISNSYTHCILKVDSSGIISEFSGDCNSSGDVPGTIGSASVRYSYPTGMIFDPEYAGNMFVVDRSTSDSSSYIKYINQSASDITIAGTTVPAGEVATVFTTAGFTASVAAYGNWVCYNSTYFLSFATTTSNDNVNCFDRTNNLGVVAFRVGSSDNDAIKGGRQLSNEYEAVDSLSVRLAKPLGLAFDDDGNLYITETMGHTIKMVKRWF